MSGDCQGEGKWGKAKENIGGVNGDGQRVALEYCTHNILYR